MNEGIGDGWLVLDDVYDHLGRFIIYPKDDYRVAHALWIIHCHLMNAWESTPRMGFMSPEPGSGKTRALEVTRNLVPRPVEAVNVTPAYLFRKVGEDPDQLPTVLFDEIDTVFGPKAKENEEIRGLINAGHRKGAVAGRCVVVGKTVKTEEIPAYCPIAMAGLDDLPDTIRSRSVIVQMRRRAPHEVVEPYRRRVHEPEGNLLREKITEWASLNEVVTAAINHVPEMPDGITDRNADVWEPLLTVADLAGRDWPKRARVSAVTAVTASMAGSPSLGVRLLADLKTVFGERESLYSSTIVSSLIALEEAPWADLRGRSIDKSGLARRLAKYGVKPTTVRESGSAPLKGYRREDLHDAWQRYLPRDSVGVATNGPVTPVTPATSAASESGDMWEH